MDNCVFCRIVAGEIPSYKVYEDEETLAFLDIRPVNHGHTLVIPKAHFRNILDISENAWGAVSRTVRKISIAVKEATGADGVNVRSSHEPAAGQEVLHLHTHIIPRFSSDGLKHWPSKSYADGEAENTAEAIKNKLV